MTFILGLLTNLKVLAALGIAALLSIAAAGWYGYERGYELAELRGKQEITRLVKEYNAKAAKALEVIKLKDKQLAELQDDYIVRSEKRLMEQKKLQERIRVYEQILKDMDDGRCTYDPADIERLFSK